MELVQRFVLSLASLHGSNKIVGKRYNVLRKRIDSWNYEVDQLLFGTILFTLMTFLFPTTFTYYALFATVSEVSDSMFRIHNDISVRYAWLCYCVMPYLTYYSYSSTSFRYSPCSFALRTRFDYPVSPNNII